MKVVTLVVWLVVSTSILAVGHFYLWRRLIRDAALPQGWHRLLTLLMVALALSQPAIFLVSRQLPRETISPLAFAAFTWMGLLSSFFTLLVLVDVVRWCLRLWEKARTSRRSGTAQEVGFGAGVEKNEVVDAPSDPARRTTFRRILAGGVALGGTGLGTAGVASVLSDFTVKEIDIELDKLPPALDGFRIVQLTDVHVGPTIGREFIERMVDTANDLRPDLVAITGDLVDGSVANLGRHTEPLRDLVSRHGTYFVTGNHEYYSGVEEWVRELERLGVSVLRNRRVSIGEGSDSFDLAGVTDHRAQRYGDAPDFLSALANRDPGRELVLLAHQPAALDEAQRHDVGLQLSGHTHGGQFWPWNWVVHLIQPVVAGWARFGRTQVYVSAGTGYWGPPMRVGTESELTLVRLRSKRG